MYILPISKCLIHFLFFMWDVLYWGEFGECLVNPCGILAPINLYQCLLDPFFLLFGGLRRQSEEDGNLPGLSFAYTASNPNVSDRETVGKRNIFPCLNSSPCLRQLLWFDYALSQM